MSSFQPIRDSLRLAAVVMIATLAAAVIRSLPADEPTNVVEPIRNAAVVVQIFEGIPDRSWSFAVESPTAEYHDVALAFVGTPRSYNAKGLIDDRSQPFMLRARATQSLVAGEYQLLLRSKNAARLFVDDELRAETKFLDTNGDGHERVPALPPAKFPQLRPLPPGHQENLATVTLAAGDHVFRLEAIVGGKKLRPEIGELCVAIAAGNESLTLVAPNANSTLPLISLTDDSWECFARAGRERLATLDAANRRAAGQEEAAYWQRRHTLARELIERRSPQPVPPVPADLPVFNDVDRLLFARVASVAKPVELTDDYEFLRRVTLDTIGLPPSRDDIAAFLRDHRPQRRQAVIDRLLSDPRGADHWVGYWQDVLAENPGILKPEQNNTGPFRWWIYESLLDNKPFDRFVTELVLMEGSKYYGGPAGFAMASQNDAPLAAKAQILTQAFLGLEMKCARCHDSPNSSFSQQELFGLAAMLNRKPLAVPKSSSVPTPPDGHQRRITVSLKPGDEISPGWTLDEFAAVELLDGILRNPADARERLAALITSPTNDRFAQVIVNRLWNRFLGWGMVDPVDDWGDRSPSHPELLDYLARELVRHEYDLRHVTRLILNSHTYQRKAGRPTTESPTNADQLRAAPVRRRMSAEQLVDSLFASAGKEFRAEELTMDPESRRPADTFLNLGTPTRAWQFTSLSNERDRPALAMPYAQQIVDMLVTFGWRDARPNPLTERDEATHVLQPLVMANGTVATRLARLSDDSELTALCCQDLPLHRLVDEMFLQLLSRPPRSDEREVMVTLLEPGYTERLADRAAVDTRKVTRKRHAVSWANHLSAEATKIKLELEREVRAGDPPTTRLEPDWRERMEDVVWALLNSPEFVFVP